MANEREVVNHPSHYKHGGIEAIDVIEAWELGFALGNTVKYISRAGYKGDDIEDLEKAAWYLAREVARRKKQRERAKANATVHDHFGRTAHKEEQPTNHIRRAARKDCSVCGVYGIRSRVCTAGKAKRRAIKTD